MSLREVYSPDELSDKEIMEAVLGRHSIYLRGWGRSSSTTNNKGHETTTESTQPSYQELVEQLNEANNRLDEVVDILRQNNLMPQPKTSPTKASDADIENLDWFTLWFFEWIVAIVNLKLF